MVKNFFLGLGLLGMAASCSFAQYGHPPIVQPPVVGQMVGQPGGYDQNMAVDNGMGYGYGQPVYEQGCSSGNCGSGDYFSQPGQGGGGVALGAGCSERYLSIFGGWNGLEDLVYNEAGTETRESFTEGWTLGGAIGRRVTANRRHELEFAYRNNSADEFRFTNGAGTLSQQSEGDVSAYASMFNIVLNGNRGLCGLMPYGGVGAGGAYIDGEINVAGIQCDVEETVLAWQAMAGVEKQLGARLTAFLEYRYFGTDDFDVQCATGNGTNTIESDYASSNVLFGFRLAR